MRLTAAERNTLPPDAFAKPDTREYPVHTPEHASASIQAATGTADEALVKALAHGRWPQLNPALRGARGTNAHV